MQVWICGGTRSEAVEDVAVAVAVAVDVDEDVEVDVDVDGLDEAVGVWTPGRPLQEWP